jgi:hypothetical protein
MFWRSFLNNFMLNNMIYTRYIWFLFNVDIKYNSSCFYAFKDLIHVFWCYREKTHHVFAFVTQSSTHSSTRYGTWSGIASNIASCTKIVGKLAIIVLAASDGWIRNVVFFHAFPLQLLNSRQLNFGCSIGRLLAHSVSIVGASFNVNCRI